MAIGQCEQHYDRASIDRFLRSALGNKSLSELTEMERQMREHFALLYLEGRLYSPMTMDEDQCVRVVDSWLKEAKEKGLIS